MIARWSVGIVVAAVAVGRALAGTQEVYVWQRQFGPEVVAALQRFQPQADTCCVLAAEVTWQNGRMRVVRTSPDFPALIAWRKPVGLALRVGPFAGPFAADDPTGRALTDLAADLLAQARAAGLKVAELQVDFDAAESKLAGYRAWLQGLRKAVQPHGIKLVFTSLPSWLRRPEFKPLAHAADGFVLQVHSLEKPTNPNVPFTLCESERALAWARQAGAAGVPFRVALPTYGYVIAFNADGKFLGLAAEGPRPSWPVGTQLRVVRADAVAMARLAQSLAASPPPNCTGVIWYRLPIAGDRLNWDGVTLAAILRGEIPHARITVEVTWPEAGLAEIAVANLGNTTESLPPQIALRWPEAERLRAADALGGFRLDARGLEGQATIVAAAVPPDALVAPGQRVKVAWLRFSHELPLDASLPASLPPP